MAEILWTLGAVEDLEGIAEYISRDSGVYASVFVSKLVQSVEKLMEFPLIGRIVPEFEDKNLREIIVNDYRVVYCIKESQIGVVAVVHGGRDLIRRLTEEQK